MDTVQYLELGDIKVLGRSYAGQNRLGCAGGAVNVEAELDHPLDHALDIFLCCMVLHRYDHCLRFALYQITEMLWFCN
ncbi:hypothetical protein GCM10011585_02970 [Edaphobacter dinghuensis]|uniref:Uncharacterized protein n=1 Tax=Edaphobacter dinghuensis TaxID=1560005 RepID=A0A917H1Q9_9BACT|nr:hypothetical protein GCM10011585_02970 [Edaphobacter dinghuensis]